ncbi:MAG: hypothetical protein ACPGQL_11020 [Thermoplasmatota archaeon]
MTPEEMPNATRDRLRVAMKFSLWMWALYWPGGGLILAIHGLDPVSLIVTGASLVTFVALVLMGGLRATSSHNVKEFMLERPLYFIAGFVVLFVLAISFLAAENAALRLFSFFYMGSMALVAWRLWQHVESEGGGFLQVKADQMVVLLAIMVPAIFLVFADAWLPLFGAEPIGGPAAMVALVNWINLAYPPLLMAAAKPFREPLRRPKRERAPTPAEAPTPGPAADGADA